MNKQLKEKLAKLSPTERKRVEAVALRLAKARLANMLDQTSRSHRTRARIAGAESLFG